MLVIGLTGGIASGKTLVSDTFAELGAPIVDADLLAREVVEPGSDGLNGLVELFGSDIIDQNAMLDRAALRTLIFNNPKAREKVDALLHPMIRALSEKRIHQLQENRHPYIIYAVPLLVETGQMERFDRIVVVDVPVSLQVQRLMSRDDSTEEQAKRIIKSQASQQQRLAVADEVVDNSGTIESTVSQVQALHEQFTNASI